VLRQQRDRVRQELGEAGAGRSGAAAASQIRFPRRRCAGRCCNGLAAMAARPDCPGALIQGCVPASSSSAETSPWASSPTREELGPVAGGLAHSGPKPRLDQGPDHPVTSQEPRHHWILTVNFKTCFM